MGVTSLRCPVEHRIRVVLRRFVHRTMYSCRMYPTQLQVKTEVADVHDVGGGCRSGVTEVYGNVILGKRRFHDAQQRTWHITREKYQMNRAIITPQYAIPIESCVCVEERLFLYSTVTSTQRILHDVH
jgi:hypothetical protein